MSENLIQPTEEYFNIVVGGDNLPVEIYCLGMSNNAMNEFLTVSLPPDLRTNFWNVNIKFPDEQYIGCENFLERQDVLEKASEIISERYSVEPVQILRMFKLDEILK
jgi:hypothetical protein